MKQSERKNLFTRDIVSIGLDGETRKRFETGCAAVRRFETGCAAVRINPTSCDTVREASALIAHGNYCLILLHAEKLTFDETQEAVIALRKLTYAQMFVLTFPEAIAPLLEVGADVCAPFNIAMDALFSQTLALIRRTEMYDRKEDKTESGIVMSCGGLTVDLRAHRVMLDGQELRVRRRDFRLLTLFIQNPGIVLTPDKIGETIWLNEINYNHNVTAAVAEVRRLLNDNKKAPRFIETVRGVGYRFLSPE